MDLSLFATQTTNTNAKPLNGGNNPLLGAGGLDSLNSIDNAAFWNAILSNLSNDADGEKTPETLIAEAAEDITAQDGIKKETVDLALLQLGLLGQDVDKSIEEKLSELKIEQLAQVQNNRAEQLTKLINHLTNGLPQEIGDSSSIEDLVARLTKRLDKLESSLDAFRTGNFNEDDAPFKLLIATGLNPVEFTKITSRIEEVEAKLGRELTVEDLIAGVGNIIPVPNTSEAEELSSTDTLTLLLRGIQENKDAIETQIEDAKEKNDAQADQQNADGLINLVPTLNNSPAVTSATGLAPVNGSTSTATDIDDALSGLPENMSNAEFKALFGSNNIQSDIRQNVNSKKQMTTLSFGDQVKITTAPASLAAASFKASFSFNENLMSQSALGEALGFDIQTGTPFSHTMQAVNAVTTSQQTASQPHPGTNMVAAQMKKVASSGDTSKFILQMDPDELGRVEVRMEFGADKKVTAHLIVEKPETFLMLQRDQSALERALQNAGMETDNDSLNFELASDDYGFGSDNESRDGNSGTQNAKNNTDDSDMEIIETNIDWNIDPVTGHVRYNLIA